MVNKYWWVEAKNLTTDDLKASKIPNRYFYLARGTVQSENGISYTVTHQYDSAYHENPIVSVVKSKYSHKKPSRIDTLLTVVRITSLTKGERHRISRKYKRSRMLIDLNGNHTQKKMAEFFDKYNENFKKVRIRDVVFTDVPEQFVKNPGFSRKKLEVKLHSQLF